LEKRRWIGNIRALSTPTPPLTDELAQALALHCPVALSLHDERGGFCAASAGCEQVFGRDPAALLGTSLAATVDPRDVDRVRDGWDAVVVRGQTGGTLRYRLAGLDDVWVSTELRPLTAPVVAEPRARIACASRRDPDASAAPEVRAVEHENAELARRHRDVLVRLLPGLAWYGQVSADLKSYRVAYLSEYLLTITGYTRQQWLETPGFWRTIIHPEDLERTLQTTEEMMRGERNRGPHYRMRASDGHYLWVQSSMFIDRDEHGAPVRMYGLTLDITSHVEIERENAEIQRELAIRAQRILELSAPLLPIGDGVLLLPLIGVMDPARSEHAFAALLEAVQATRARRVIIDLTGIGEVDRDSVATLVRATEAVRLLGARPMLTGLQPAMALALLELDMPFHLRSFPSIAEALRAR